MYLSNDYFKQLCSNEGKIVPAQVLPLMCCATLCPVVMLINKKFDISCKLDISRDLSTFQSHCIKKQAEVLPHSPVATWRLWWAYPLQNSFRLLFRKTKSFEKFINGVNFILFMYKICIYCVLKTCFGVLKGRCVSTLYLYFIRCCLAF